MIIPLHIIEIDNGRQLMVEAAESKIRQRVI